MDYVTLSLQLAGAWLLGCAYSLHPRTRPILDNDEARPTAAMCVITGAIFLIAAIVAAIISDSEVFPWQ